MSMWWSWALAAVGLVGMWLAGTGKRLGWTIGVLAQLLWIAYALATRQYGFLVTALAYAFVYLRNLHHASKTSKLRVGGMSPAGARSPRERTGQSRRLRLWRRPDKRTGMRP